MECENIFSKKSYCNIGVGGAGSNILLDYIGQCLEHFEIGEDGLLKGGSKVLSLCEENQLNKCFTQREFSRSGEVRYISNSFFLDCNEAIVDKIFYSQYRDVIDFSNIIYRELNLGGVPMLDSEVGELVEGDYVEQLNKFQSDSDQNFIAESYFSSCTGAASCSLNWKLGQILESRQKSISQYNYFLPDFQKEAVSPSEIYCMILGYRPYQVTYGLNFQSTAAQSQLDRKALYGQQEKKKKKEQKGFEGVNEYLAENIFQMNACFFSSANCNTSMRKFATNMILYPRINQFIPHCYEANSLEVNENLEDQIFQGITKNNSCLMNEVDVFSFANTPLERGRLFNGEFFIKGEVSEIGFIKRAQKFLIENRKEDLVQFNYSFQNLNQIKSKQNHFVACHTDYGKYLQNFLERFSAQFRKKSFLHYFCTHIHEMEFVEYESNFSDLISEFQGQSGECYSDMEYEEE